MPKKTETGHHYIKAVTDAIKNAGSTRELYLAIHGVEPSRQELQRFINRLNPSRCNPGADMLGLCVEHLPSLHNMTLKTFFAIEGPETEQDKKGNSQ